MDGDGDCVSASLQGITGPSGPIGPPGPPGLPVCIWEGCMAPRWLLGEQGGGWGGRGHHRTARGPRIGPRGGFARLLPLEFQVPIGSGSLGPGFR